jgi:hypothetical protein
MTKARANKAKRQATTTTSVALEGTIADLDIVLEASREGDSIGFSGRVAPEGMKVGDFVQKTLGDKAADALPPMLHDRRVLELGADFSAQDGFEFICTVEPGFPGKSATMSLEFKKKGSEYLFGATLVLDPDGTDLTLSVQFEGGKGSNRFVGSMNHFDLDVKSILGLVSDDLAKVLPDGLTLGIDDLIVAHETAEKAPKILLGANLKIGDNLSLKGLPIVGEMLPNNVGISSAQILANTEEMTKEDLQAITKITSKPNPDKDVKPFNLPDFDLTPGAALSAALNIGSETRFLKTSFGGKAKDPSPDEDAPAQDTQTHHSFGPLNIYKTGFEFRGDRIWITLDAAIIAAGITMSFKGLGLGIKLSDLKDPQLALEGIGLGYDRGGVRLSGMLQRQIKPGSTTEQFAGAAVVATKAFNLSALGAYSKEHGKDPSLFLFAVLDRPLGGPAFFFVKGLAAGFGYNRRLIAPTVDDIDKFPLIQAAMKPADDNSDQPQDMLSRLDTYLPAAEGENFVAVGVRFSTFELIETFALLTLGIGKSFDATLLGISTLEVPPHCPTPPLARVRIGLVAHVDEGALEIDGKILKGSYLFSEDCHLSGGFAFYSWFTGEHAGDFVMTVGGYHPKFRRPAHYPKAERLALNWQVDPSLLVKGNCYFALTSLGMMAGGHLSAVWISGPFSARFKADADFLVVWEPYHYEADISVSVSASYTFKADLLVKEVKKKISVEVGAGLQLRGPEFSGTAYVDLEIISFTVSFGSDRTVASSIPYADFAKKFLPKPDKTCTFTLRDGLIETVKRRGGDVWIVNPKTFHLIAESAVPSTQIDFNSPSGSKEINAKASGFASPSVRPVGTQDVKSNLSVNADFEKKSVLSVTPIAKSVPAALWGTPTFTRPSPNDARLLKNALCGLEIRPKEIANLGKTAQAPLTALLTDPEIFGQKLTNGGFSSPDVGTGKGINSLKIHEIPVELLAGFSLDAKGDRA